MHDIKTISFDTFFKSWKDNKSEEVLKDFLQRNRMAYSWSWITPQIYAYIANNYKLPSKEDIDGRKYLALNIKSDWDKGLYVFLVKYARGTLVKEQTKADRINFSGLVPPYMAAHKMYGDVPYSSWQREPSSQLMPDSLYKAASTVVTLGSDELLRLRELGLKGRPATTTASLYGLTDTPLAGLPMYSKVMLTQIWCAHPLNRTKYMILDAENWDGMPEPLVDMDVLVTPPKSNSSNDEPLWV
jgi:hypothetical protein